MGVLRTGIVVTEEDGWWNRKVGGRYACGGRFGRGLEWRWERIRLGGECSGLDVGVEPAGWEAFKLEFGVLGANGAWTTRGIVTRLVASMANLVGEFWKM